jgi:hypothetical protein
MDDVGWIVTHAIKSTVKSGSLLSGGNGDCIENSKFKTGAL